MKDLITRNEVFIKGDDGNMVISAGAIEKIRDIEVQRKEFDKAYKKMKSMLLDGMETYGIKKADTDDLLITYVAPTERIGIDTDKLWAEYSDVAFECQKFSSVKSGVKITVR